MKKSEGKDLLKKRRVKPHEKKRRIKPHEKNGGEILQKSKITPGINL